MDQDNKNTTGAPAGDTTSALFVSARKKQLEQQEVERRAKEKEAQRLAAEAEVRRLEKEVEDRRRKTEEEAKQAEEEARRIAEEARAKMATAAENPDAVLGAQPEKKGIRLPKAASAPSVVPMPAKPAAPPAPFQATGGAAAKPAMNKKLILIIGGAAVALLLIVIVLIVVFSGGSDSDVGHDDWSQTVQAGSIVDVEDAGGAPAGMKRFHDNNMGIAFNYDEDWSAQFYKAGGENAPYDFVLASSSEDVAEVLVANYTEQYNEYVGAGGTDGNELVEELIGDLGAIGNFHIGELDDLTFHPLMEHDDGSIQFTATWTLGGQNCLAAVSVFQDRGDANAAFVISDGQQDNNIEALLGSIEVW